MFGRIQRVRLRTSPMATPSLCHACARTLSSKSRTEAIFSAPPKAVCILWKSCNASWPDDEAQNKSIDRATEAEKRGWERETTFGLHPPVNTWFPALLRSHTYFAYGMAFAPWLAITICMNSLSTLAMPVVQKAARSTPAKVWQERRQELPKPS